MSIDVCVNGGNSNNKTANALKNCKGSHVHLKSRYGTLTANKNKTPTKNMNNKEERSKLVMRIPNKIRNKIMITFSIPIHNRKMSEGTQ
jgi:hypothetical protein